MNRRGFLGFFGGAAAAGPKLAAGIADSVASLGPAPYPSFGTASEGMAVDVDWKVGRINELKAIISGRDPQADQNDRMNRLYAMEQSERFRLDSLRSVSPIHKQRMLTDGASERHRRIRRADAKWDLKRLLSGN